MLSAPDAVPRHSRALDGECAGVGRYACACVAPGCGHAKSHMCCLVGMIACMCCKAYTAMHCCIKTNVHKLKQVCDLIHNSGNGTLSSLPWHRATHYLEQAYCAPCSSHVSSIGLLLLLCAIPDVCIHNPPCSCSHFACNPAGVHIPITQDPQFAPSAPRTQPSHPPPPRRHTRTPARAASAAADLARGLGARRRAHAQRPRGWVSPAQQLLPRSEIFYRTGFSAKAGLPCKRE